MAGPIAVGFPCGGNLERVDVMLRVKRCNGTKRMKVRECFEIVNCCLFTQRIKAKAYIYIQIETHASCPSLSFKQSNRFDYPPA